MARTRRSPGGSSTGGLTARTGPGKGLILRFGIRWDRIIIGVIAAGSGRFSRRATTLVFAGEDSNAFPPHENRSKGLPWEVKILLKAPLRGAGGAARCARAFCTRRDQASWRRWSGWSRIPLHGRGISRTLVPAARGRRAC